MKNWNLFVFIIVIFVLLSTLVVASSEIKGGGTYEVIPINNTTSVLPINEKSTEIKEGFIKGGCEIIPINWSNWSVNEIIVSINESNRDKIKSNISYKNTTQITFSKIYDLKYKDGKIYVLSSKLYIFNESGFLIKTLPITGECMAISDYIYIVKDKKVYKYDMNGKSLKISINARNIRDVAINNDLLFVTTKNAIYLYEKDRFKGFKLSPQSDFTKVKFYNNLYVVNKNKIIEYEIKNYKFNLLKTYEFSSNINDFAVFNNTLYAATNEGLEWVDGDGKINKVDTNNARDLIIIGKFALVANGNLIKIDLVNKTKSKLLDNVEFIEFGMGKIYLANSKLVIAEFDGFSGKFEVLGVGVKPSENAFVLQYENEGPINVEIVKKDGNSLLVIGKHQSWIFGYGSIILKVDKLGNVIWSKENKNVTIMDAEVLNDGYVFCGYKKDSAVIFKANKNGKVLWARKYSVGDSSQFNAIEIVDDGFVVVGSAELDTESKIVVLKLDLYGNFVWGKLISCGLCGESSGWDVKSDGNYYVVSGDAGNGIFLLKISKNGRVEWWKRLTVQYIIERTARGYSFYLGGISGRVNVEVTNDGYYVSTGSYRVDNEYYINTSNNYILLLKFNKNGKHVLTKVYNTLGYEADSIHKDTNGGFIITSRQFGGWFVEIPYIFKIDGNGNLIWAKVWKEKEESKTATAENETYIIVPIEAYLSVYPGYSSVEIDNNTYFVAFYFFTRFDEDSDLKCLQDTDAKVMNANEANLNLFDVGPVVYDAKGRKIEVIKIEQLNVQGVYVSLDFDYLKLNRTVICSEKPISSTTPPTPKTPTPVETPKPTPTPAPTLQSFVKNLNTGKMYDSIQQAVNAASPGDTILVFNKKCNEVVKVNKPLTLKSSGSEVKGFEIYAENVTIDNFTTKGYGLWSNKVGILIKANNVKLANNTITDFDVGICIENSNNNTITRNNIKSNNIGIKLSNSFGNLIYLNNFDNSDDVKIENSENRFYSPHLMLYEYNNKRYVNYLGNYWNECDERDENKDGIGDYRYCPADPWSWCRKNYDDATLKRTFENYKIVKLASPLKLKREFEVDDAEVLYVTKDKVFIGAKNDILIYNKSGRKIGEKHGVGKIRKMSLNNDILYLNTFGSIYLLNVTNPSKPRYVTEYSTWGGWYGSMGDFFFVNQWSEYKQKDVLKVIDASNPKKLEEYCSIESDTISKYIDEIKIIKNMGFVGGGGITVLNLSNLENPEIIDKFKFESSKFYTDGRILVTYGRGFTLSVFELQKDWVDVDALHSKEVGFWIDKLEIIGNYMLLLSKGDIVIYNISDLSNPELAGVEHLNARDIFVYDDEIYIATPTGIKVYTIDGQSKPVAEFNYKKSGDKVSFEAVGNYIKYEWDVDGEKKEGKRIEHTFSEGIHFVTLKVTDRNGFTNVKTKIVKIGNIQKNEQENKQVTGLVIEKFEPENYTVYQNVPLKLQIIAYNKNGIITKFEIWTDEFGFPVIWMPKLNCSVFNCSVVPPLPYTIKFRTPGEHKITLIIKDDKGNSVSKSLTIKVLPSPEGEPPEIIDLSYKPEKPKVGDKLEVTLHAKSVEGVISEVELSVTGLGSFFEYPSKKEIKITKQFAPNRFSAPDGLKKGKYTIKARVVDSYGHVSTKTKEFEVI